MSKPPYPKARGQMLKVWAKLECPVCNGELEALTDEHEKYGDQSWHFDTYTCDHCEMMVTYISPSDDHEYWQVADSDKYYALEMQT